MPRSKAPAPERLGEGDRRAATWNLGDDALVVDQNDSDDESEDLDYVPTQKKQAVITPAAAPARRKSSGGKKQQKRPAITEGDEDLAAIVASAAFCVPVAADARSLLSSDGEWHVALPAGRVELKCQTSPESYLAELKRRGQDLFWLYVSPIDNLSAVFFAWFDHRDSEKHKDFSERRKKAVDPDGYGFTRLSAFSLPLNLFEGFVGKRCPASLVLDSLQIDEHGAITLALAAEVTESNLAKLGHPSDVPLNSNVHPVRATMNHCLDISAFNDGGAFSCSFDEDMEIRKPDIDDLYDVVKRYHEETRPDAEALSEAQHHSLLPQLRPYQKAAVAWMLAKERRAAAAAAAVDQQGKPALHPLYREVTMKDGTVLYYHETTGSLVRERPLARFEGGGILADEMGLGKTVEVLACMLCNPRVGVAKPEWQEPILLEKNRGKKWKRAMQVKRKRTPSPVEFLLVEKEEHIDGQDVSMADAENQAQVEEPVDDWPEGDDVNNGLMIKVEGHADGLSAMPDLTGDPLVDPLAEFGDRTPERRLSQQGQATIKVNDDVPVIRELSEARMSQMEEPETTYPRQFRDLGEEIMSQLDGQDEYEDTSDEDDEDYVPHSRPRSSRPRAETSRRSRSTRSRQENDNALPGEEAAVAGPSRSRRGGSTTGPSPSPSRAAKQPKATAAATRFDPHSVLDGRTVTAKSPLTDMVLAAVVWLTQKNGNSAGSAVASVHAIRSYVRDAFGKCKESKISKVFNNAVRALLAQGSIVNATAAGVSGSFKINPDFANFDSRGSAAGGRALTSVEQAIEDAITKYCYDGAAYVKPPKDSKKSGSTYSKLKASYELEMARMSEAYELTEEVRRARKKWNGTFFDTKVAQSDFFECVCGSDLDADSDAKHRVQCSDCQLWQHSECVHFDVADPFRGDYACPHCWTLRAPVASGATLIVSPTAISHQWIEEIQKHVRHKNVRMLFYEGTKQTGYIQPRTLAAYDIVVTTYTVLQSETSYVDLPHSNSAEGRRFRNPKRFMATPAPLPCVEWWRVCLDEAQMIECTTTRTAEMALRLAAANRWCVTGTPIEKSLNDLRGLLLFLGMDPYGVPYWWRECLYAPYLRGRKAPMEKVLCSVLWRTAKKDVLDQINIPSQSEEVHWLSFSPVEEHFYRQQHIECSNDTVARINRCTDLAVKLSEMERNALNSLLNPLLRLRQSCCHPQAVRGQFLNLQKSSTMTMEELLVQMIKKATLECEDSQRVFFTALNGLAAIDIIEEKWVEAVAKYREALGRMDEMKDRVKTDTLQRLHAVTNLAELLEAKHEGVDPTLRDHTLRQEAEELKQRYLTKYNTAVLAAKESIAPATALVEEIASSFDCDEDGGGAWYERIVNSVSRTSNVASEEEALMKLVREEMAQFYDVVNSKEFAQIEQKYSSSRMVLVKVGEKVTELDNSRERIVKELNKIRDSPPATFLNAAVDCHLRQSTKSAKNKKQCKLCQVDEDLELYENVLFHFVKGELKGLQSHVRGKLAAEDSKKLEDAGVVLLENQKKGTWADSESERLMRALLKFARGRQAEFAPCVLGDGAAHLKLLEAMKKEFRLLRILWRQVYDLVAAVDELNMSALRLRLKFEDEPHTTQGDLKLKRKRGAADAQSLATRKADHFETIYILEAHELPSQKLKLMSERTVASAEFQKKFGMLTYLQNLKSSDFGTKTGGNGGENPEPCPVCQQALGKQWSVLQCGHCYCVDCVQVLVKQYSSGGFNSAFKCPVCRSVTKSTEISYVNTQSTNDERDLAKYTLEDLEKVKGSLSTKVEAIVRTLMCIVRDDPEAKCLVFSSWTEVLDIIGSALTQNDIQFAALHAQGKFKRNLQKFKNRTDVFVLLMPVTSGAHGLNLVEANHVLLVEPLLNPAQELQAIGRVHRIGQTRHTVVHRFVIRSTIEERMHKMLSTYNLEESKQSSHSTEENTLTLKDLKRIFVDEE